MDEPAATRTIVEGERLSIRIVGQCYWDDVLGWVIQGWGLWGETDPRDLAWHEIQGPDGSWEPYTFGGWAVDELRDFSRASAG